MSDELLKRLETGHDKECAMSYGMHEHCCDCSYPARQEAAARVRELEAERDALTKKLAGLEQYRSRDQLVQRVLRAEAERDALRALLNKIAAITHDGGLRNLSEWEALVEVRRLTVSYWDCSGSVQQRGDRIDAALREGGK